MLDKYVGQMIELVYMDRAGRITQREIRINSVKSGKIRASSGTDGSPRTFLEQGVLAWRPISHKNKEAGIC